MYPLPLLSLIRIHYRWRYRCQRRWRWQIYSLFLFFFSPPLLSPIRKHYRWRWRIFHLILQSSISLLFLIFCPMSMPFSLALHPWAAIKSSTMTKEHHPPFLNSIIKCLKYQKRSRLWRSHLLKTFTVTGPTILLGGGLRVGGQGPNMKMVKIVRMVKWQLTGNRPLDTHTRWHYYSTIFYLTRLRLLTLRSKVSFLFFPWYLSVLSFIDIL